MLLPLCSVPSRAKGNQLYVPELDRIVLKDSASQRPFASTATCRKAVITTRILQLVGATVQAFLHVVHYCMHILVHKSNL